MGDSLKVLMLTGHLALQVIDQPLVSTISRKATNKDDFKNLSCEFKALAFRSNIQSLTWRASLLLSDEGSEDVVDCVEATLL